MLRREQLTEEIFKIIEFIVLANALLAGDELVDPFVVLSSFSFVLFQFTPNTFECSHIHFDFIAQFINESQQA